MSLINMLDAYLSFSDILILNNTELNIENNERVCFVGRNGAGKSTLMRVLTKEQSLDNGEVIYQNNLKVAYLKQDPPQHINSTVFDFIAEGTKEELNYIKSFNKITKIIEKDPTEKNLNKLAELQKILDRDNLWLLDKKINNIINQLQLQANSILSVLSGGWLRKAALARALICDPHVLFLDEPTNHLDINTILWLENFLKDFQGSIVFISHDRSFIRHMATRIINLDRGKLISWPGNYDDYLINKEKMLRIEKKHNTEFDHKLLQEEIWIRKGIKARCTRNEGRVKALKLLRIEHSQRDKIIKKVKIKIEEANNSGRTVFKLKNVNYCINNKTLINNFSIQVQRGDKIALIGSNGSGKTTLIKLLLGQLEVNSGNIYRGTKLKIIYFDQHRKALDPDKTVIDNLVQSKQEVIVNGRPRHVIGYLHDFLFHPKRATMPVKAISSGEKNRLLLARLFLTPSNLFILDEPTNDLDTETLELLEELIDNYKGTVLLVSHDRQFIDNIATKCWIFKDSGKIEQYVGSFYDNHLKYEIKNSLFNSNINKNNIMIVKKSKEQLKQKNNKISYHLLRELELLQVHIKTLKDEISILQSQVNEFEFFNQPYTITKSILKTLTKKEIEMEMIFKRWQELKLLKESK
ncbi:MAG: ABC transporter ATP-binding protein [Arsenophonus sp. ET-DL12-MAG3]